MCVKKSIYIDTLELYPKTKNILLKRILERRQAFIAEYAILKKKLHEKKVKMQIDITRLKIQQNLKAIKDPNNKKFIR